MSLIKRIKAGEGTPTEQRKILEMLQGWKPGPSGQQTEPSTTDDATSDSTDDADESFNFGYPKKKKR
jgi:hypothetical protein